MPWTAAALSAVVEHTVVAADDRSVWADLESVVAFDSQGPHAAAVRGRREWFMGPRWSTSIAWLVAGDHLPTWPEAAARLEYLHDAGPPRSRSHSSPASIPTAAPARLTGRG